MGQGVVTSLAQMLADELDVPLESVDMVMGDTDLCPWDMGTFGSMTTRFFGPPLRAAAAEARAVLIELAAERLELPRDAWRREQARIVDTTDPSARPHLRRAGRRARRSTGASTGRRRSSRSPTSRSWARPVLRRDAEDKVTGHAQYAGDIRLPGMLYAPNPAAARARRHARGGRRRPASPRRIAGVRSSTRAIWSPCCTEPRMGRSRRSRGCGATWDSPGSELDQDSIFDHLVKVAPAGETVAEGGDLAAGRAAASAAARQRPT